MSTEIRMQREFDTLPDQMARRMGVYTSVTVFFKDSTRIVLSDPKLGAWDCSEPLSGQLYGYDLEAGYVIVLAPHAFGYDNAIRIRFDRCTKVLVSAAGEAKWTDLIHEASPERIRTRAKEREDERKQQEAKARQKRERALLDERMTADERERKVEIALSLARANERAYERQRETEIEMALRQAVGEATVVVALTDEERSQVRRVMVARLLGPKRVECYHRLVWPGLSASQFALGPAPADRPQYQVRFAPRIEDHVEKVYARCVLWIDDDAHFFGLPTLRSAIWDRPWDPCPDVAPPGYPDTTPYERARSNILGKQHIRSMHQTDASVVRAIRFRKNADAASLRRQIENANRAEYMELQRRDREAREAVARLTVKKEE